MHELAICDALVAMVADASQQQSLTPLSVTVRVGPLSGVEPTLLERAFPLAAAGTPAEHACLYIEATGVRVRCRQCAAESTALPNRLLCGSCGAWQTDLIEGDELILQRIEFRAREPESIDVQ